MDSSGWQPYQDPLMGRPAQFNSGLASHPQQLGTKYGQPPAQTQPPVGYTYETFQTPGTSSKTPSANSNSKPISMGSSPTAPPRSRDYVTDADTTMEDADPYNRSKYPSRPNQHTRASSQFLAQAEESSAARRYSPMNVLSPPMSYPASPGKSQGSYGFPPTTPGQSRRSPARAADYSSPPQGYQSPPDPIWTNAVLAPASNRPPRLPPLQAADLSPDQYYPPSASSHMSAPFGPGARSPRSGSLPSQVPGRGPVPKFQKIKSVQELQPRVHTQPAYRRANPEGGFISPLQALTTHLPATYRICNPNFNYESSRNPRRVLTKPSKGVKNDGYDNEDSDYILYVNDILGSEEAGHKNRYLILDVLGQGTFGQVVKCQNLKTQEVVAVKVIKNKTAYFNQSMMEVSVLDLLNSKYDKNDDHHLLRLKDTFIHRQHLCLAFELLSVNLYELIKQNQFRGLSTTLVRVFAQQLLNALSLLNKAHLIHCDLKPENILLKKSVDPDTFDPFGTPRTNPESLHSLESPIIKVIDFGSACDERQTVYTYIQSRFYRSPEVLLGLPYSSAIDMWSLGCIVVELFLGLPLFPGSSEYNQVCRIVEMLGLPPTWMLEMGKQSGDFFEKTQDEYGRKTYRLKSLEQYSREHNTKEQPSKKYFSASTLEEIIRSYPMPRKNMKQAEIERELNNRVAFIDFVRGLLTINPLERWSPQQAKLHPFITQQKFTGPFVPPMNLKYSTINKAVAPGVQQQQQAEAASKQRAAQAAHAQSAYNMQLNQYHTPPAHATQAAPIYNGMYQQGAPPPYPTQPPGYSHQMGLIPGQVPQQQQQQQQPQYAPSQSLYAQATTRAGRQRASTMDPQGGGIPPTIQRVASHLDPNAPIRLQPSPAYYPPPPDGYVDPNNANQRRRGSRTGGQGNQRNRDFIRTLEDGVLGEGYMGQNQWH
ncbi:Serine/threonine-protein kinase ppk15 [Penicillium canariense]|uniref:Serine/threonine-protein kinase ppk15 n=1 Tax=Penicillium canariense TaxID=189055 RepID=A0A9W9ICV9_9EURO|nr:Serine/threonine-protein kinase ppk15 [Penicillium canariense]KAJ5175328.1 Serine/threonine-protein kinase ppk15 [Penicillium canariense]